MKKILSSVLLLTLLVSTANAGWIKGDCTEIKLSTNAVNVRVAGVRLPLVGTEEKIKQMYALALSAYMADETVAANRIGNTFTEITIVKP